LIDFWPSVSPGNTWHDDDDDDDDEGDDATAEGATVEHASANTSRERAMGGQKWAVQVVSIGVRSMASGGAITKPRCDAVVA